MPALALSKLETDPVGFLYLSPDSLSKVYIDVHFQVNMGQYLTLAVVDGEGHLVICPSATVHSRPLDAGEDTVSRFQMTNQADKKEKTTKLNHEPQCFETGSELMDIYHTVVKLQQELHRGIKIPSSLTVYLIDQFMEYFNMQLKAFKATRYAQLRVFEANLYAQLRVFETNLHMQLEKFEGSLPMQFGIFKAGLYTELETFETGLDTQLATFVVHLRTQLNAFKGSLDRQLETFHASVYTQLETFEIGHYTLLETFEAGLPMQFKAVEAGLYTQLETFKDYLCTQLITFNANLYSQLKKFQACFHRQLKKFKAILNKKLEKFEIDPYTQLERFEADLYMQLKEFQISLYTQLETHQENLYTLLERFQANCYTQLETFEAALYAPFKETNHWSFSMKYPPSGFTIGNYGLKWHLRETITVVRENAQIRNTVDGDMECAPSDDSTQRRNQFNVRNDLHVFFLNALLFYKKKQSQGVQGSQITIYKPYQRGPFGEDYSRETSDTIGDRVSQKVNLTIPYRYGNRLGKAVNLNKYFPF